MSVITSRTYGLSVIAVVAAAGLCVVAIARAVTVEPVETTEPAVAGVASGAELSGAEAPAARVPSEGVLRSDALALAVDNDPFMPDRSRAQPYRLPDERVMRRVEVVEEEPVDPPPFRVVGTASAGERSMALVQPLESAEIDMVLVGGSFEGYRLESVDDESATLVMRDRSFRLGIQEGMAAGPSSAPPNGMPVEVYRRLLEQLRERGLSEEAIGRIMDANLNAAWSGNGQRALFNFGNGLWDGVLGEVRVTDVPAAPPQRQPFGRAGRGGRAARDTLSFGPR